MHEDDHLEMDYEDLYEEPDLDFMFETDSALASIGWGNDEDYGYFGDDE